MNDSKTIARVGLLLLLTLLLATVAVGAGGFNLDWWTIDGGGGRATGAAYTLDGTIGQPDAGVLAGGDYGLSGGFWSDGGGLPAYDVYLPSVRTVPDS